MRNPGPEPADLGPVQILRYTDLTHWQLILAQARGLAPEPDVGGSRWSLAAADDLVDRRDAIVDAVGSDPPVGGRRAANRLGRRTGLPVDQDIVERLVDADILAPCGHFKGWPLYDALALDAIPVDELLRLIAEQQQPGDHGDPTRDATPRSHALP